MAKYIEFVDSHGTDGHGSWYILNIKSRAWLGEITWYKAWKRFVAELNQDAVWSADCLRDVATFMEGLK